MEPFRSGYLAESSVEEQDDLYPADIRLGFEVWPDGDIGLWVSAAPSGADVFVSTREKFLTWVAETLDVAVYEPGKDVLIPDGVRPIGGPDFFQFEQKDVGYHK